MKKYIAPSMKIADMASENDIMVVIQSYNWADVKKKSFVEEEEDDLFEEEIENTSITPSSSKIWDKVW
ncbi:MAG: hypothetical protein J6Y04_08705 [Bacteroidaceae bacterium]|nr:hypothetical protein [Bacteroidaceae bacterium]